MTRMIPGGKTMKSFSWPNTEVKPEIKSMGETA